MIVSDKMHYLDLGLFQQQIEFTLDFLKLQYGNKLIDKLNCYLAIISYYSNLKIFPKELQSITKLIVSKYQSLIKVMIFVIDNLYGKNDKMIEHFINNNNFTKLYECQNKIYILSKSKKFNEHDLAKFKVIKINYYLLE